MDEEPLSQNAKGQEGHSFPVQPLSIQEIKSRIVEFALEQIPLVEAFFLALALHVLAFPLLWVSGWALPWPKSPVVTTIIEMDLGQWPKMGQPKKVWEWRDPRYNK